ncbi:MAG: recombinase family protein [Nitrososphaera sp.]|nr:recombinase family protein [Nitrososphaera sp.]
MAKRAAIYARVSSDEQRSNYSIPTQVEECLKYVASRGYSLVGNQFVDPETGQDTQAQAHAVQAFVDDFTSRELSRPSLDAALRYLEEFGFDIFVVYILDRLARDPYIRQTLEVELEKRGATVEYVQGNYDQSPEGEVRKDLDATFAKWENAKRVERCLRGKRGKAQRGLFVSGRPPYGYKIDPEAEGGLAVDEEQAAIVRWIFDLYVNQQQSIRSIAKILSARGVVNHSGNTSWGKNSVNRILQNTTYVGRCFYNKNKRVQNGRRLVERDQNQWIEIQTTPIVEQALFDAAQEKLRANKDRLRRTPVRFYLLTGMVVCGECDRPYVTGTAKAGSNRRKNDAQSYRHRQREGHCTNRTVSARKLEPIVWGKIVELLLDPKRLREGYEQSLKQQKATRARDRAHLETLQRKLIKLEQQLQNLTTAYIDPDIRLPKEEYKAQRTRINVEIKDVKEQIKELETELARVPEPAELEALEVFAAEIRERLNGNYDPAPAEKRKLLEMLHVTVILGLEGSVRVEGWFTPKSDGLLATTF